VDNLSIAQSVRLKPILEVAREVDLGERDLEPWGRYKAKLTPEGIESLLSREPKGKLVLVTAVTPTPAGEGKTTVSIGLAQALRRRGYRAIPTLREPAMGPVFGIKGGGCGGGYSQVLPMEDINLSFTGDFPAVVSAHNLLSAMIDAHIYHGNGLGFDVRSITWPRTIDMNDRALRKIVVGLGGKANGFPREDTFVIAPASEVMAVLCLSRSLSELRERLGRVIVGLTREGHPLTAKELKAHGAMTVILRDAFRPNLVQTVEGCPALVHGGPFGNIAHGTSSLIASLCALRLADFVVTEGGFGADLGAEKFMNIFSRQLGRGPDAVVLVVSVRALQHHGGAEGRLNEGLANMQRHIDHLRTYGVPIVLAVNRFPTDTREEHETILRYGESQGLSSAVADPWGSGGAGCLDIADLVLKAVSSPREFHPLYDLRLSAKEKMDRIARTAYGAEWCTYTPQAEKHLEWAERYGFGDLPICMAKTQYSLTADSKVLGAPKGFQIPITQVKVSAGAGFLVAFAGDILLMPGLGNEPTAERIDIDEHGRVVGLF
jgi:formate--tetrahydrofolate ligase